MDNSQTNVIHFETEKKKRLIVKLNILASYFKLPLKERTGVEDFMKKHGF